MEQKKCIFLFEERVERVRTEVLADKLWGEPGYAGLFHHRGVKPYPVACRLALNTG